VENIKKKSKSQKNVIKYVQTFIVIPYKYFFDFTFQPEWGDYRP